MTLVIDLTHAEQERVTAAARQTGLEPAEFIRKLVTDYLPENNQRASEPGSAHNGAAPGHFYFTATREEFNGALDEIAQMNQSLPALPEAAFDRENLYEDRS